MSVYSGKIGKNEQRETKQGLINITWSAPRLRGNKGTYSACAYADGKYIDGVFGFLRKADAVKELKQKIGWSR